MFQIQQNLEAAANRPRKLKRPAWSKPSSRRLPNEIRNNIIAMIGEFSGTFLFLFFALAGTQVANLSTPPAPGPNPAILLYISLSFGFSLVVNAWVFFRVTGGVFNPAVTLGMFLIGAMPALRASVIFVAQLLAGMASAAVVSALFPGPLKVDTLLSSGTSKSRGLFIEMFLTAELILTIFMLAAEKHKSTFIAPIGIGLSLFIAELVGVYYTGGSLNPARSFGPAVVNRSFPNYHWIYWVGPGLGALLACGFYKLLKFLDYDTANPGQELTGKEAEKLDTEEAKRHPSHRSHDPLEPTTDSMDRPPRSFDDGVTSESSYQRGSTLEAGNPSR